MTITVDSFKQEYVTSVDFNEGDFLWSQKAILTDYVRNFVKQICNGYLKTM